MIDILRKEVKLSHVVQWKQTDVNEQGQTITLDRQVAVEADACLVTLFLFELANTGSVSAIKAIGI